MTRRQLWRAYLEDAVLQGTEAYSYSPFCHLLSWGTEGPVSNVATCFESRPWGPTHGGLFRRDRARGRSAPTRNASQAVRPNPLSPAAGSDISRRAPLAASDLSRTQAASCGSKANRRRFPARGRAGERGVRCCLRGIRSRLSPAGADTLSGQAAQPPHQRREPAAQERIVKQAVLEADLEGDERTGGPRQQRGDPWPLRRNGLTRRAARAGRCSRCVLAAVAGEREIAGVEFLDQPAGRVVVAWRGPAGGIVARQRQPGQAERLLYPSEVGIDRLDRTDEMQRPGASAPQPQEPIRIAVRKEDRLRPYIVEHELEMPKRNSQGTIAPLRLVADECPRFCAPKISGIGEQLGAEFREFAKRAGFCRMVRDACRANLGVAVGMATTAMGDEPVQDSGPRAFGLMDVDASVAVRDHGRRLHARRAHRARRGPASAVQAVFNRPRPGKAFAPR